jgi:mycofactocin biosynthetic radical S-adenosylmethionine protein MftC
MANLLPFPRSLGVQITNRCNLACKHCFNLSGPSGQEELSLDTLTEIWDQAKHMGISQVRLGGGEPTVHPNFAQIVLEASARGLEIWIYTNGLFSLPLREQVSRLPIHRYVVSLEGLCYANDAIRGRGSFELAIATIAWLKQGGHPVSIGTHLHRSGLADIKKMIVLAAELGVPIKFSPLRPAGRALENLRDEILSPSDFYRAVQIIGQMRLRFPDIQIGTDFDILLPVTSNPATAGQAGCPAGNSMMNINYDGYIYPCIFLATPEHEFAAGHLTQASLATVWQESALFRRFRELERDAECQRCFAYQHTCAGGCPAMAYFLAGRLEAHDPQCFAKLIAPSNS